MAPNKFLCDGTPASLMGPQFVAIKSILRSPQNLSDDEREIVQTLVVRLSIPPISLREFPRVEII